jgi:hypothetical protein
MKVAEAWERTRAEGGKTLVGLEEPFKHTFIALLVGGHVLLEGVPGTAKTLLARTMAHIALGRPAGSRASTVRSSTGNTVPSFRRYSFWYTSEYPRAMIWSRTMRSSISYQRTGVSSWYVSRRSSSGE